MKTLSFLTTLLLGLSFLGVAHACDGEYALTAVAPDRTSILPANVVEFKRLQHVDVNTTTNCCGYLYDNVTLGPANPQYNNVPYFIFAQESSFLLPYSGPFCVSGTQPQPQLGVA